MGEAEALRSRPRRRPRPRILVSGEMEYWSIGVLEYWSIALHPKRNPRERLSLRPFGASEC
jgi:hypothetical protein